ncbi:MAG: DHHA1 domain-containing protein [Desulfurococcaceae archaeon]
MKCIVLAHGDSDGVASASLVKAYFDNLNYSVEVVFTHPAGLLSDLKEFVKDHEVVFIVDVALNELHATEILNNLSTLANRARVVYVDHHPLPEDLRLTLNVDVVYDTCCSASELTYRYLHKMGLGSDYARIALYGAIGDYLDETPWVKQELDNWDKRSVYLEAGILIQGLEGARRDYEFKRRVVEHLSKNNLPSTMTELVERSLKQAAEDEKLRLWVKENVVSRGLVAYVLNPPGSVGRAANYARVYGRAKVGIAIEERKEMYVMSLRSEPGIDLNRVLRILSRELGVNGGGHPRAAGARVKKELFERFLLELERLVASSGSSLFSKVHSTS